MFAVVWMQTVISIRSYIGICVLCRLLCSMYLLLFLLFLTSIDVSVLVICWVHMQFWKGVFQLVWTSGHAVRVNFRTGIEGPAVSPLNCDRPLHWGSKTLELVMDASCRDNRWTASLCMWPPGCSPLVPPPARRWAVLEHHWAWLVVNTQVKACFRDTHSLSQASKIYGNKAFQITHTYTPLLSTVAVQHYSTTYSPHTLWGARWS